VNGLSCFACHCEGLLEKFDEVQEKSGVKGSARLRVARLYRSKQELGDHFKKDNKRFLAALHECYRPFLAPDDAEKEKEPIVYCHQEHIRPLGFNKAAHELEMSEENLRNSVKYGSQFVRENLSSLGNDTLDRTTWERIFPRVVRDLQLGRPVRD